MSGRAVSYSYLMQKIGNSIDASVSSEPGETANEFNLRRTLLANPHVRQQRKMEPNALARCITNVIINGVVYSVEVEEVISSTLNLILQVCNY